MKVRNLLAMMLILGPTAAAQEPPPPAPTVAPAASTEPFKVARGPYDVIETDVTLRNASGGKDLELRVRTPRLPKAQGAKPGEKAVATELPLLVFSHGAGGSRDAFAGLQDLLASHGYACIAPTHSDSLALARKKGDGPTGRDLMTAEGRRNLRNSVRLSERVQDCTSILDQLNEISMLVEKAGGEAFTIHPEQIAIAGHSAGAYTTQLCAGVKIRGVAVGKTGQGMVSIGDPRFKAAVIISGQGTASAMLSETSWDEVSIPLLVFSGSLDGSPPNMGNETPQTRRHPFEKSRGTAKGGPPAYLLYIEGATHGSYQGRAGASERLQDAAAAAQKATPSQQVGDATNAAVLTFLDAHVRKDAKALATLDSDALATTIPGNVEYQRK